MGSLVTISNGESDLENILAKRASVVRECLDDGVPLDDTYHLAAEEGCVSYEDDAMGLDDAMPLGPLDDAIPLDDSDVIPLEASALLSSPHNVTDVEAVLDQRQASPSESSCTVSSSVTPAEGNSPHHPHDQAAGRGGQEEQSSETKSHGKKVWLPLFHVASLVSCAYTMRTQVHVPWKRWGGGGGGGGGAHLTLPLLLWFVSRPGGLCSGTKIDTELCVNTNGCIQHATIRILQCRLEPVCKPISVNDLPVEVDLHHHISASILIQKYLWR